MDRQLTPNDAQHLKSAAGSSPDQVQHRPDTAPGRESPVLIPSEPEPAAGNNILSPWSAVWKCFKKDRLAVCGLTGIIFLLLTACFAPVIANGRPIFLFRDGRFSLPMCYFLFAPDSTEMIVEKIFNYFMFFLPVAMLIKYCFRNKWRLLGRGLIALFAVILLVPFICAKTKLDKTDWGEELSDLKENEFVIFAPIAYGPFDNVAPPYQVPGYAHLLGTDKIGRDVLSRMLYGARVSLAVGILATAVSLVIGIVIGMMTGYFGGKTDIIVMRIVEIIMCFPTFLLLLILMAIMMDYKFEQSILLVIAVIGLTSWTGLSRIVRGEVLKQRALPYIRTCESLGIPVWRIMLFHLLPNVVGPILVSFTFGVAGAIIAESGLSFLGFGVQTPTASWGELLRQAFTDPFNYWYLTLWPGIAIFISVLSFNFAGEGLRQAFDPQ